MSLGLIGIKRGMTRLYNENGEAVAVSVIEIIPNFITQIKTIENDGYSALQVSAGKRKRNRLSKALAGHFAKASVEPGTELKEFVIDAKEVAQFSVGTELKADRFQVGQYVDVIGCSKGKGFAGVVKRHNFRTQDMSHGNSLSHRGHGSIGQRQSPGKVFKGKKMSGHMGDAKTTVLSQPIVRIDAERNLILVKGAIPGAPSSMIIVRPAVKKSA